MIIEGRFNFIEMKTIKLFVAFFITATYVQISMAQVSEMGLYLTREDYRDHKLSFENAANQIRLNGLFETSDIIVWHDGKKQVLSKNEVFGYRLKNEDYRFFNNSAYRIIDTIDFYIYSRYKLSQQNKGLKPVETYYFSTGTNTTVEMLTISNLKTAYTKNTKFRYSIEQQFRSDNELMAYDSDTKEYKLKYLFNESVK